MTSITNPGEFQIFTTTQSPGRNLPQDLGRALWFPMWLMAAMGFAAGFVLAVVRANEIASGAAPDTILRLQHVVAAFMFIGFAGVFAAISFAIARILGEFRAGGGDVQEAAGRPVQTLKMPLTAKLFILSMAMAMMTILAAVALHLVFASSIENAEASLRLAEQRFIVLEGVRRVGIALYLISFLLGLGTIIHVLRFQTVRIRQLPDEGRR